jgi:hypothetical protein
MSDPSKSAAPQPTRAWSSAILHEDARDVARQKMNTKAFASSRDERKRVAMRFAHLKITPRFRAAHGAWGRARRIPPRCHRAGPQTLALSTLGAATNPPTPHRWPESHVIGSLPFPWESILIENLVRYQLPPHLNRKSAMRERRTLWRGGTDKFGEVRDLGAGQAHMGTTSHATPRLPPRMAPSLRCPQLCVEAALSLQ